MTSKHSHFKKTLLASMISAALAPHAAWAIDFAQTPAGSVEPFVAPNVIISVDDSGSMDFCLNKESASDCIGTTDANNNTVPNADGTWPANSRRMNVLKYALKNVFNDLSLVPDGKIRLAWQVLWNNGGSPGAKDVGNNDQNAMRILDTTHRTNFLTFVDKLKPSGGTPSHLMMSQADAYMRRTTMDHTNPWASKPMVQATPFLGCRRSYHIMMTDGRWNGAVSGGQKDGPAAALTLPDGTQYVANTATTSPNYAQTRIYRDAWGDTLADWAFYSWSVDMQTAASMINNVPETSEYRKAPPTETIGGVAVEKYWNPKYDPATWQHMVTYTIGFSDLAQTWKADFTGTNTKYNLTKPTETVPFGYDGSVPDLIAGTKEWPQMSAEDRRALDLWHASINGRGKFYAVKEGNDLQEAFRAILARIGGENSPDAGSTAASGTTVTRNDVASFTAGFDPTKAWKGWITSETVQKDGTVVPNVAWGGKNTAEKLDVRDINTRLILSYSDLNNWGVPFKWATDQSNLSTTQKTYLSLTDAGANDGKGQDRLNFIRGSSSLSPLGAPPIAETTPPVTPVYTALKPFRQRYSIQGDIINSNVWYTGAPVSNYALKGYTTFARLNKDRQPMVYVGGNDGMLHGFSMADGSEKIAYVPKGVIRQLGRLADPTFDDRHLYYVDGSPFTGDVDTATGDILDAAYVPDWRTMLVGTLGAGGKGYFVLDVTNPGTTSGGASNFTEANAKTLVVMDKTLHASDTIPNCDAITNATDKAKCKDSEDMGHIFAPPVLDDANPQRTTQITRMNNNRWAVVMGNGYNSKNQRPVLMIQYLDGAKEVLRLVATGSLATGADIKTTDNGLSAPRLVDINGDGRPDVAYAGDLKGNMWKFIIASSTPTEWGVAFGGAPLYTAVGLATASATTRNVPQPITIPPTVRANDRFASGKAVGGMMVAFGTGQNLAVADRRAVTVQSIYSILDNTRYRTVGTGAAQRLEVHPGGGTCPSGADCVPAPAAVGTGVSSLAKQSVSVSSEAGQLASAGRTFWNMTKEGSTVTVDWTTQKGWYLDLPDTGERQLKPMSFFDGSNIMAIYSQVPAMGNEAVDLTVEVCEASTEAERQYLTLINIMDAKPATVPLMDLTGDGKYNSADKGVSRMGVSKGAQTMIKKGNRIINYGKGQKDEFNTMPEQSMRPSWRQLQ
jgi:type IV pilus assembly protein PilY1